MKLLPLNYPTAPLDHCTNAHLCDGIYIQIQQNNTCPPMADHEYTNQSNATNGRMKRKRIMQQSWNTQFHFPVKYTPCSTKPSSITKQN